MQTKNLVNGRWITARSGAVFPVADPANDEHLADVPDCGAAETLEAIQGAQEAFPAWAGRSAAQRGAVLQRMAEAMVERTEDFARLMTREQGKPLREARGEVAYAAGFLRWAAAEGERLYGEIVPASSSSQRILVLKQPLGVTACITPWNFPLAMITRKLGPALAAGNTMVVKPAEQTPLTALALAELAMDCELPPGVLQVITGSPEPIAGTLLREPAVRKLSFTGSTEVGRILMRGAAENLTRLSLELGGHAPFLVFEDADLDQAVEALIANKFRNAGQTCICANRILVQDSVHDAFVDRLVPAVEKLAVGSGLSEDSDLGPLIDDDAVAKVERHVADAVEKGATLRCGGERVSVSGAGADRFFAATVLTEVGRDMLVSCEETFGPVVPVSRFGDEAEAIERANDSPFGLAAYFFTRDAGRLMRVAEGLEYGIVGANDGAPSSVQAPFGGVKHSGFGREGGHYVMHEYVSLKYLSWRV